MGLDVRITVRGECPPVWKDERLHEWCYVDINELLNYKDEDYCRDLPDGFELCGLMRYYGPGYERGSWPRIHAVLIMLAHMYPDATIRYGDDTGYDDHLQVVDTQWLAEMWDHYWGDHGDDYHRQ